MARVDGRHAASLDSPERTRARARLARWRAAEWAGKAMAAHAGKEAAERAGS